MACPEIAMSFLLSWGLNLTAPTVEIVPTLPRPGLYDNQTVYIRENSKTDCGVWVHEYVHAWQEQNDSKLDWFEREKQARSIELAFRGRE